MHSIIRPLCYITVFGLFYFYLYGIMLLCIIICTPCVSNYIVLVKCHETFRTWKINHVLTEHFHIFKEATENFKIVFEQTIWQDGGACSGHLYNWFNCFSKSTLWQQTKSFKMVEVSKLTRPGFVYIIL